MIDWARAQEVFQTLQDILNVSDEYKMQGAPVKAWLTPIRKDLSEAMKKNPDQAEAILDWFAEAFFYMRGDSDDLPRVDIQWTI